MVWFLRGSRIRSIKYTYSNMIQFLRGIFCCNGCIDYVRWNVILKSLNFVPFSAETWLLPFLKDTISNPDVFDCSDECAWSSFKSFSKAKSFSLLMPAKRSLNGIIFFHLYDGCRLTCYCDHFSFVRWMLIDLRMWSYRGMVARYLSYKSNCGVVYGVYLKKVSCI